MTREWELPGFDRLLKVCQEVGYPVEMMAPGRHPPVAGALMAGQPFDPMLATLYRRIGGALFGGESGYLHLNPVDDEVNQIAEDTQRRQGAQDPLRDTMRFGSVSGLAWYYATVPVLADEEGLQPVVFIDDYDECPIYPVASSVDRFFYVFSCYVERMVRDEAWQQGESTHVDFPGDVVEEVAKDARLVEMLKAGRFQFLMKHAPGSFQWVEQVLGVLNT